MEALLTHHLPLLILAALTSLTDSAKGGIALITHGAPDVTVPHATSEGGPGAYGIGTLYQLDPVTVALFANVRTIGVGHHDFEDGTDALLFRALHDLPAATPVPLSRNEEETGPDGERRLVVKFPLIGGFVPLGATLEDGGPHPAAGTGFGCAQALSFPYDGGGLITWKDRFLRYVELQQLRYDGSTLTTRVEIIRDKGLLRTVDGQWSIHSNGLQPAIPDGADMLFACVAHGAGGGFVGVSRWRFADDAWRPVSFVPISRGSEPSLVRDHSSALLFSRRGGSQSNSLELWRSTDGVEWTQVLNLPRKRTASPVGVDCTPDGRAFICGNVLGTNRDKLMCWEATERGDGISMERTVRDCTGEFGPAPDGTFWACDHPTTTVVRLADERWHGLLAYRLLAFPRTTKGQAEPMTPQTGCHVEEIHSTGTVVPAWRF